MPLLHYENPLSMIRFSLSILFILPISLFAQKKVDLDKFGITVQFRSLPNYRLDSSYGTYNVEVEGTQTMVPFIKELEPEKSVMIDGWKKLPADGHLNVKVKIDDLLPESFAIRERVENITDRNGRITGTRILYSQEVTYTFSANAIITDYKGIHIKDQELASRSYKQTYTSPEFPIKHIATGYFMLNSRNIISELYRNSVNKATRYLSNRLSDDFGFGEVTVNDNMWIIDSKKHPEYDAHRKAFQQINTALFSLDANTPIDEIREQLKPVIKYFESIKKNYSSNSKHDRKIRYASFYNLAVLYYYLDDPQMMMKEASALALNDFDSEDARGFEESALRLKNQFQLTNIYTRHFKVDPNSYKGPFENTADITK
jgi:hypothetical protein